jgi:hypothetical protein
VLLVGKDERGNQEMVQLIIALICFSVAILLAVSMVVAIRTGGEGLRSGIGYLPAKRAQHPERFWLSMVSGMGVILLLAWSGLFIFFSSF